jgi:hypothetical protein
MERDELRRKMREAVDRLTDFGIDEMAGASVHRCSPEHREAKIGNMINRWIGDVDPRDLDRKWAEFQEELSRIAYKVGQFYEDVIAGLQARGVDTDHVAACFTETTGHMSFRELKRFHCPSDDVEDSGRFASLDACQENVGATVEMFMGDLG